MALAVAKSLRRQAPRRLDRRSEAEELRMELRAAGQEMKAIAQRIHAALVADLPLEANQHAGRLWALGNQYEMGDI